MKNAKKPEHILKLEEGCPSALSEILDTEAAEKRKFMTYEEAVPELTIIARDEGLNLTNTKEFREAVRIMDMDKLGKR